MNKKDIFQTIIAVAIGFLISGLILLINRAQPKTVMELNPPPTPRPIMVFISGEVQSPNVYALPKGSRLNDLIKAAGGFTDLTKTPTINLAAILYDGQHVVIKSPDLISDGIGSTPAELINQKVNINEASAEELTDLPGIGATKADAIVQYRLTKGPFEEIKDILNVPGIGDYTFELIKDLITTNQLN